MRFLHPTAFATAALLVFCGFDAAASNNGKAKGADAAKAATEPAGYTIGADDMLAVNVWKEPEISRTVLVRPDGNISLPLIGDLRANGRTPDQLRAEISQRLLGYLSDPEVTVIVQEARSQKFNILGEVERPGSYPLGKAMTVLDAIAVAGGFRDFAKTTRIFVLRVNSDGSRVRIPFNYKEAIKGQKLNQNTELQPHDTVVVP
jgi:polysaccharide export outer membrane protein